MTKRGVGLVVERAEAVIEQVRARIGGKRAGYGQTLALTARDVRAALGDGRCQPLGALDVAPTASGRSMDGVVGYLTGGRS